MADAPPAQLNRSVRSVMNTYCVKYFVAQKLLMPKIYASRFSEIHAGGQIGKWRPNLLAYYAAPSFIGSRSGLMRSTPNCYWSMTFSLLWARPTSMCVAWRATQTQHCLSIARFDSAVAYALVALAYW